MAGIISPLRACLFWVLLFLTAAQVHAETATFSLDDVVRPPFNPICPETVVFRDGGAALTLNGGGLITGSPNLGNPTTIYVSTNIGCTSGAIRLSFNPPAANPTFTLSVPSFWRDQYRITAQFQFSGATHSQIVELNGAAQPSQKVTVPLSNVRSISIVPLQTAFIGWIHYVDDISFEYEPSNAWDTFAFEISPATPEVQRRVLIHKYRPDGAYPSPWQKQDFSIEIVGTARNASGGAVPGATVHFRVIDPPDTSPYVPIANQTSGDNTGPPGTLSAASAVTDGSGNAATMLETTDTYAGDNYQIEASPDPQFSCAPNCSKSGVLTAWKRIYVEVNKMFRRGKYLITPLAAGDTVIPVNDFDGLTAPMTIKLIHAPKVGGSGTFYEEDVRITALVPPTKMDDRRILRLDPVLHPNGLKHAFDGPDEVGHPVKTTRPYLADAFGVVTGKPSDDYYLPLMRLVAPLFEPAYVEHVWLIDTIPAGTNVSTLFHAGYLPFHAKLRGGAEPTNTNELEWLARKWTHHAQRLGTRRATDANHQILFMSSTHFTQEQKGLTHVAGGSNDTWVHVPRFGSDTELAEGVAHELAHAWRVNHPTPRGQTNGGHCDDAPHVPSYAMFGAHEKMCLMTSYVFNGNEGEDGVVGFHYTTGIDGKPHGEYLHVRRRPEPVPQNEISRQDPK